jgi:hypothetical protein
LVGAYTHGSLEHWCQAFTFIAVSYLTQYRIRRIDPNPVHDDLAISKRCLSKKPIAQLVVSGDRFRTCARPNPFVLHLKNYLGPKSKTRLRTSVTKEGTASGKHKEYRSPCIAAHTLLLRAAFARAAKRATYMNNLIPGTGPNSFQ